MIDNPVGQADESSHAELGVLCPVTRTAQQPANARICLRERSVLEYLYAELDTVIGYRHCRFGLVARREPAKRVIYGRSSPYGGSKKMAIFPRISSVIRPEGLVIFDQSPADSARRRQHLRRRTGIRSFSSVFRLVHASALRILASFSFRDVARPDPGLTLIHAV